MVDLVIYDESEFSEIEQQLSALLEQREAFFLPYTSSLEVPEQACHICWLFLSDEQLRSTLPLFLESETQLAVLPHPNAAMASKGLALDSKLDQAVDHYLQVEPEAVDLLMCNQLPVLQSVTIGDMYGFVPGAEVSGFKAKLLKFKHYISKLSSIQPKAYHLTTRNNEAFCTAAVGITVVEHGRNSTIGKRLLSDSHLNDGMFHILLLAPRSVMELLAVMLVALFARQQATLPRSVGTLKTDELKIACDPGIEYSHDGTSMCSRELSFTNHPRALQLLPSSKLSIERAATPEKESRRMQHLPKGEGITELCAKPLRWVAHAAQDDFRELYQTLREQASPSPVFLTLMILSTLLASLGLFADSPPVIIGAMILAPLMGPIISLSMALARQDESLLKGSVTTLSTGLGLALLFAVLCTWLLPLQHTTSEIAARVSPTLLDLGVAVISGIAGAYAHARAAVTKSLAGVAIAVALVPPLAVAGIGLGWMEVELVAGALLLFLTNLAGIVLAAAATFLVLGFAPFKRARKGLLFSALAVALVSVPLAISFNKMAQKTQVNEALEGFTSGKIMIQRVQVLQVDPLTIKLDIVSSTPLEAEDYLELKQLVEQRIGEGAELQVDSSLRL
ncbi:TIGR00341 family protein [Aliagarivorans taiwanensis]|uniref:TIGR00341 family protein n=1 Tax=Aliagarivorans taiwanensis TaxID=561966 RepID=UPI00040380B0|nr:TIGR00341 family protein [Aliagarivorans taiwanensis]